jgi:homogentisate 1,2-dioxygenase
MSRSSSSPVWPIRFPERIRLRAVQLEYQTGFGNGFETEALPGTLPIGQNSPQQVAHGLYAEQLSGSPFTAPRLANERSWLYRIRPSVQHFGRFAPLDLPLWCSAPDPALRLPPGPQRWDPVPAPDSPVSFVEGVRTVTTAGDVATHDGIAAHLFFVTRSMQDEYFADADGELLFVPQDGALRLRTELGVIEAVPSEIVVIPRGVKFSVELVDGPARGYLCENYGGSLTLPERGPIGANCLANPRDFLTPVAAFEDRDAPSVLMLKWGGRLWSTTLDHSPLDVVAWHGNYAPYKYDLTRFSPVGPLLFDHADPSIFTTLTSPSDTPGTANVDFVIFPDRWMVAEHTFRPPWFHQNVMSEFMGLVRGVYDAKPHGFVPGGMSLHNSMTPHGPDAESYAHHSTVDLEPVRMRDTLAFMFETRYPQRITEWAASLPQRQDDHADCWRGLEKRFSPPT